MDYDGFNVVTEKSHILNQSVHATLPRGVNIQELVLKNVDSDTLFLGPLQRMQQKEKTTVMNPDFTDIPTDFILYLDRVDSLDGLKQVQVYPALDLINIIILIFFQLVVMHFVSI